MQIWSSIPVATLERRTSLKLTSSWTRTKIYSICRIYKQHIFLSQHPVLNYKMASYKEEEDPFEEIVFDQARLLNTTPKLNTAIRRVSSGKCVLFAKTLGICGVFFGLGLCIAIPGPTFLLPISELQVDVALMTNIYVARSSGYAVGSIIGGILFDRFNRLFLLFVSLLLTSVFITVIPWCRVLWLLKACMVGLGMSMGFLDTGCNVLCLDLWGRNSAPFMQGLHFSFGLGMFVAPLLAPPFYEPFAINTTTIDSITYTNNENYKKAYFTNKTKPLVWYTPAPTLSHVHHFKPITYDNDTENINTLFEIISDRIEKYGFSKIQFTYLIVGLFVFAISLLFLGFLCHNPRDPKSKQEEGHVTKKMMSSIMRLSLIGGMAMILLLSSGLEVTFGHLVMAYAVNSDIQLTQSIGSNISVTFWAAFAVMRFASIFFATGLSPTLMLILNLVCCTLGTLILYAWSDHVETALWVGTILLGAGLASMFPTGLLWIERLLHVSNKVAALLVLGVSLGELACPALIRHLMVNDPKVLMRAALFLNTLCIVIFATLWWLSSQLGEKYCAITSDGYQLANQHDEEEDMMNINLTGNAILIIPTKIPASPLFSCGSVKVSRGRNAQAIHGSSSMLSRANLGRSALSRTSESSRVLNRDMVDSEWSVTFFAALAGLGCALLVWLLADSVWALFYGIRVHLMPYITPQPVNLMEMFGTWAVVKKSPHLTFWRRGGASLHQQADYGSQRRDNRYVIQPLAPPSWRQSEVTLQSSPLAASIIYESDMEDWVLLHIRNVQRRQRRENIKMFRRQLRDTLNPFELLESEFKQLFRMSRRLALDLCDMLSPHLEGQRSNRILISEGGFTSRDPPPPGSASSKLCSMEMLGSTIVISGSMR
uniref:Sodium-dependent glucose transporter 1 n=2 Tax=Timema douglasi TaxID=61478 RepID=A0A7R8VI31_TIMDO|nr:unnamed protein product [Timema douglasi]